MKKATVYVKPIEELKEGCHITIPPDDKIYEVIEHYNDSFKETKIRLLTGKARKFIKHGTMVLKYARKQKQ